MTRRRAQPTSIDRSAQATRRKVLLAVAATCLMPAAAVAQATSGWPDRPIRLVVPFAPGGTSDVLGRLLAANLSNGLGQQVVVENRAGANGNIGTDVVAKAPADGYSLLMTFDGTMAINPHTYAKLPFDPQKDLAPVINAGQAALVMVMHPGVKAATVAEFVELVRKDPGGIFYGSAGIGSTGHLAGELFAARAGIKMTHVSYKGGAAALQDLLAGQIQMLVTALPTVEGLLANGKVRALAVTPAKRVGALKDVPALAETYPGYAVSSWYGIVAPAGTPEPILSRLNAELDRIVKSKAVQERFETLGVEPLGGSRASFAEKIRDDSVMWADVVRKAGVKVE
ncbi:MAG: Bug family tripartite tricarboxylate transporter substrate binding protein [Lautropia sp.]